MFGRSCSLFFLSLTNKKKPGEYLARENEKRQMKLATMVIKKKYQHCYYHSVTVMFLHLHHERNILSRRCQMSIIISNEV